MIFSSVLFLFFFLPAALLLYFVAPRPLRLTVLTLCSFAFYAWSDPRFVLLLLWTAVFDYCMGNVIGGAWSRREPSRATKHIALVMSLTSSIGLLVWFKYAGFGQAMLSGAMEALGIGGWTIVAVVLPAGISFYTFESISYVVDVYRGTAKPAIARYVAESPAAGRSIAARLMAEAKAFVAFACYLSQFPHLVAGPIIRFQELEAQLHRPRLSLRRFAKGIVLMSLGLAKKVLIADTLAPMIELGFTEGSISTHHAWWVVVGFALQIYFDFSGYTDMAMGMAMMLGFRFPRNFDAPYRATSITEFWRRWHMTLSRWLRDYIYIALGGNRRGHYRTYVNLFLTMLIGGLWHGAGWGFILWGAYHGIWLIIERAIGVRRPTSAVGTTVRVATTFAIVCLGWTLFRSPDALLGINLMFSMTMPFMQESSSFMAERLFDMATVLAFVVGGLVAFSGVEAWQVSRRLTIGRCAAAMALLVASILVLSTRSSTPFLYFKF